MSKYIVYKYTSPSNKNYIGLTKQTKGDRSGGLFGTGYTNSVYFKRAIDKYGIENFKYEILESELTFEQACEKERYYIKLYDSNNPEKGYNLTIGGEGNPLYDYEQIYNLYQKGKSVEEICKIIGCSNQTAQRALNSYNIDGKERIKRSAGQYHIKQIAQYNKKGELLNIFNSISDAERETGVSHSNIIANCKGRRHSAGGFIWTYFSDI